MNALINSHAPLKILNKKKKKVKKHGLQEVSKIKFIRKTDSLKNMLNVTTTITKMLYIMNMKHVETICQL